MNGGIGQNGRRKTVREKHSIQEKTFELRDTEREEI